MKARNECFRCNRRACRYRIHTDDLSFDEIACNHHRLELEKHADATLNGAMRHHRCSTEKLSRAIKKKPPAEKPVKEPRIHLDRLDKANAVLSTMKLFSRGDVKLMVKSNRIAVIWNEPWNNNKTISKVWIPLDRHFPTWHDRAPWGGTCSTALSQMVRWVRGLPVFGISVWKYWASDTVRLCAQETIACLESVGYPAENICILCKEKTSGLDWWTLDGASGPCCSLGRCKENRYK